MRYLDHDELVAMVGKERKEGEILAATLRRCLLEGGVTPRSLLRYRGFGRKGVNALLEFLELEKRDDSVVPLRTNHIE